MNTSIVIVHVVGAIVSLCGSFYMVGRRKYDMYDEDKFALVCACVMWPGTLLVLVLVSIAFAIYRVGDWFYRLGRKSKPDA